MTTSFSDQQNLQRIKQLLRNASLKITGPRLIVMAFLSKQDGPISHKELVEGLAPCGIDRATIYRNLMDLTKANLLARHDRGDHIWRFEMLQTADHHDAKQHPHFICTQCGKVECLPDLQISMQNKNNSETPTPKISHTKKQLMESSLEIQLRGRCSIC